MRNLRKLIVASGGAGIDGQSFKSNVTGAAEGVRMTDYLISNWAFAPEPMDPSEFPGDLGTYPDNSLYSPDVLFTRGSQAFYIQRLDSPAWSFSLFAVEGDEPFGSSVTLESFSTPDSGGVFTLDLRLRGAVSFAGMFASASAFGDLEAPLVPNPPLGELVQPARWAASPSSVLGGHRDYILGVVYIPDLSGFNPMFTQIRQGLSGLPIRIANRATTTADFDFRWYIDSTYTTLVSTAAVYEPYGTLAGQYGGFGPYQTYPNGTLPGESATLWMQWKWKTSTVWNNYPTPIVFQDERRGQ
jgi:hypothetical protein